MPDGFGEKRPPTVDEAPVAARAQDLVKYLWVELYVHRENVRAFEKKMRELVELMFDYKRWELVFASYPISGKLNRFIHVWRIPDESDVLEVMRVGALRDAVSLDGNPTVEEEFRFCYRSVQELVVDTEHQLVTALPYDPNHVGYQTQTVLVDGDGDIFVLDHNKLRELTAKGELQSISKELEEVRRTLPRVRPQEAPRIAGKKRRERKRDKDGKKQRPQNPRHEWLETIQEHLNRGSTVATIRGEGSDRLLFNLAGLKPRSVYQPIDTADLIAKNKKKLEGRAGDGVPTIPAKLLIATPWGDVYDVGAKVLQKVADSPKEEDRVREALKPLLEGNTPLAAVPEERDDIIGDGCACYVINLQGLLSAARLNAVADNGAQAQEAAATDEGSGST